MSELTLKKEAAKNDQKHTPADLKPVFISAKEVRGFYPSFESQLSKTAWKLHACIESIKKGQPIPNQIKKDAIREIVKLTELLVKEPYDSERNYGTVQQLLAVRNDLAHNRSFTLPSSAQDSGNTPIQNGFELKDAFKRCLSRMPREQVIRLENAGMKGVLQEHSPRDR